MPPPEDGVLVRPAVPDDAASIAEVHLLARASAAMPPSVHTDDEVRAWHAARVLIDEVWVAESVGEIVAYARLTPIWLDDLYVLPTHAGRGIGTLLLDLAKSLRPTGFGLWVFEMNTPARAFYARHGLVEIRRTDGSDNEEQMPDLHLAYVPERTVRIHRSTGDS